MCRTGSAGPGRAKLRRTVVLNDTKASTDLTCSLPIINALIDGQDRRFDTIDDRAVAVLVDAGQQPQIVAGGVVWGVAGWLPWPRSMVWTAPRDLLTAAATSEEIEAGMGG
ncbi:hypothetical protein [Streptomyces sp. NPDC019539]|uniref:hypothetical protein n=1 Tax=Streptomyces sp. NPDC019539 TaxID=3365063 RepID=UPI0037BB5202